MKSYNIHHGLRHHFTPADIILVLLLLALGGFIALYVGMKLITHLINTTELQSVSCSELAYMVNSPIERCKGED